MTKLVRMVYIHEFSDELEHECCRSITSWVMAPCCLKTYWNWICDSLAGEFTIIFRPNFEHTSNISRVMALWFLKVGGKSGLWCYSERIYEQFWPKVVRFFISMGRQINSNISPITSIISITSCVMALFWKQDRKSGLWSSSKRNFAAYFIPMDPQTRLNMSPIPGLWAELWPFAFLK